MLRGEGVTQNFLFKDTACAVTVSGAIHMNGTCYRERCQVNLDAQIVCVTLVELERIPPFCKFTEKGQQRENRIGPLGRIQLQALEWAEHSPRHQISPEISLAEKAGIVLQVHAHHDACSGLFTL